MSNIKFRAWDEKGKRWLHGYKPGDVGCSIFGETIVCGGWLNEVGLDGLNDVTVEQYTGLKDKHDVGIYQGDVLDQSGYAPCPYSVSFSDGAFRRVYPGRPTDLSAPVLTQASVDLIEDKIIGNIHDNPELTSK